MQIIEEIKDKLDIAREIGRYVELHQAGGRLKGICPFHTEKTASFFVFPDSARWKCFGCGASGDLLDFVMRREGWDMGEAIRQLAGRAGVVIQPQSPEQRRAVELQRGREAVFAAAAEWLHANLMGEKDAPASAGLVYARDTRKLTEETIKLHGLGYFGEDWGALRTGLQARGIALTAPAAVALVGFKGDVAAWWTGAGLEGNPPQEWVQAGKVPAMPPGLLIYPHVLRGRVIYLSGRRIEVTGDMPKSWNPRRELAGEKRPFFNALWGKPSPQAVIVEGQMCAITLGMWGIPALALAGCEA